MDALGEHVSTRFLAQNGEGFLVGEAGCAADHRFGEADGCDFSALGDIGEDGEGQPVDTLLEAANAVAQCFGQHRNDAVGEVNAIPARVGFVVESGLWLHVVRDIGDMDAHAPAVRDAFDVDCVIVVLGVIGIDREDKPVAEIFAFRGLARIDLRVCAGGILQNLCRKFHRQAVLANDREHVHTGCPCRSEHFDEMAFGVHVAGFPRVQMSDDLIADLGIERGLRIFDVEVLDEAGIVRHNVKEIFGALQCADDGFVRAH